MSGENMFDAMIAELGPVVTIANVRAKFPDMVGHVMRRGERVERGVYKIDVPVIRGVAPRSKEKVIAVKPQDAFVEPKMETSVRAIEVIDNIGEENLVPEVSSHYVPWGCHAVVKKVLSSGIFAPVFITGESGNGKTMGVEQACAQLKREIVMMNITNETSEEDLIGSYILQDGNMIWRDGPVIVAMRRGAVVLLDEVDQARPAILALQTVAQGKPYFIKKTNELVRPAKGFALIATANTKGDGANSDQFAGAQVLNEAFLDRFPIIVEQEYPNEPTERRILKLHTDDAQLIQRLSRFGKLTRQAYADGTITQVISTRRLVQICQNIAIFGNELHAVKFALARFNAEHRDNFFELYSKLLKELPTDEADPVIEDTPAENYTPPVY